MSNSEDVIAHLRKVASKANEAVDFVKRVTAAANPQYDRACVRCKKPFSRLHFLPENPAIFWEEIHESVDGEICQTCDPGISAGYIGSETFYLRPEQGQTSVERNG